MQKTVPRTTSGGGSKFFQNAWTPNRTQRKGGTRRRRRGEPLRTRRPWDPGIPGDEEAQSEVFPSFGKEMLRNSHAAQSTSQQKRKCVPSRQVTITLYLFQIRQLHGGRVKPRDGLRFARHRLRSQHAALPKILRCGKYGDECRRALEQCCWQQW
ncbi:hypothetical protein TGPRC2_366120 [Toxoplasma gondii TgCatPRC2]|uniref:Uncharacterized protein n=3 Tax=Toxoplasma gondii TaxID=5811 RepID=A0A151HQS2_TOXGO|nr:hypothetical protein TGDOM2_366120 [Toxoplasma gondii GAB2-2007-GAL-DOM2]KYF42260.1 hypothetical protein TGARI_366120 [Toxoplasma gondii ARI]KYK71693.1 hypothetical protein TGPRC2_366120 [Toxoplasma gondii TgCatPRC2]